MHFASSDSGGPSRRVIDTAVGVLIGVRGCTEQQAFEEIAGMVRSTGSSLSVVTATLVALARGNPDAATGHTAFDSWADLFSARPRAAALRSVG